VESEVRTLIKGAIDTLIEKATIKPIAAPARHNFAPGNAPGTAAEPVGICVNKYQTDEEKAAKPVVVLNECTKTT